MKAIHLSTSNMTPRRQHKVAPSNGPPKPSRARGEHEMRFALSDALQLPELARYQWLYQLVDAATASLQWGDGLRITLDAPEHTPSILGIRSSSMSLMLHIGSYIVSVEPSDVMMVAINGETFYVGHNCPSRPKEINETMPKGFRSAAYDALQTDEYEPGTGFFSRNDAGAAMFPMPGGLPDGISLEW